MGTGLFFFWKRQAWAFVIFHFRVGRLPFPAASVRACAVWARWQTAHYCHPEKVVQWSDFDQLRMQNSGFHICKEVSIRRGNNQLLLHFCIGSGVVVAFLWSACGWPTWPSGIPLDLGSSPCAGIAAPWSLLIFTRVPSESLGMGTTQFIKSPILTRVPLNISTTFPLQSRTPYLTSH